MKKVLCLATVLFSSSFLIAQRNCLTSEYYTNVLKNFPGLSNRYGVLDVPENAIAAAETEKKDIIIPIAVHIVWNSEEQKVKEEMVQRQIDILNEDYAARNTDIDNVPALFATKISGDTRISFRLDTITYTQTTATQFNVYISDKDSTIEKNEPIKFTAFGGKNGLPCTRYLNIWVGNIKDGSGSYKLLCGYATPPGGFDRFDGVVIHYSCFGTPGLEPKFNKGRTATHEIGHWLNLRHLWGNNNGRLCKNSDDGVDDTPVQIASNVGCPVFPKLGDCTEETNDGEMFMNYMDYVNDPCMIMFSAGQMKRMRNCFVQYPQRAALLKNSVKISGHGIERDSIFTIFNPDITSLVQGINGATLEWLESNAGEKYTILIRELNSGKWEKLKLIQNNKAAITGLKPGAAYEVIVKVLLNNDKIIESAPYLFIADSKMIKPDRDRPDLQVLQD